MDLYRAFANLEPGASTSEFVAIALSERRRDFLAKTDGGCPVFLLHDSSASTYTPAVALKNVSVQFHSTCRVTTPAGAIDGQFAVVSCDSAVPELFELFVRCFAATVERLPDSAGTRNLETCILELLDLFRALSRPSSREVTGLWGELFVISASRDISGALNAWRADQFERFDFSWADSCLEVKATVREQRQHDFAVEQLMCPSGGKGYVVSLLLQPLSGGLGVMDLARGIEAAVVSEPALRQKLWENVGAALGSDFSDRLDRRFDHSFAKRNLSIFAMSDVPVPSAPNDPRISNIRFRVDLTTVHSSLAGAPDVLLGRLIA
mgnify:CR=1 FL=1